MNNAELILTMQDKYDGCKREEILINLNTAISLGKSKGLEVDRYRALPKITNRSKHTVMSWFNRPDKKIPLVDLCMIAKYLHYNVFAFFNTKTSGMTNTYIQDFLVANDYYNEKYPIDSADIYIRAYDMQYNTDKNIVVDNLEKYYGTTDELLAHHSNKRQVRVMHVCKCTQHSYYSWFNRSRTNVRIPLIALCKLAVDADVDIFDLMTE